MKLRERVGLWMLGEKAATSGDKFSGQIPALIGTGQSNRAIWNTWSYDEAVRSGYKACAWVFACENKKAKMLSSVPWKAYERQLTDGRLIEKPGHAAAELLRRPTKFMDGSNMFETGSLHLGLGGNCILKKVRAGGVPKELWILTPGNIKPVPKSIKDGGTGYIDRYEYSVNGERQEDILFNDAIHLMNIDPGCQFWGMPPILAAATAIDTDVEAVKWNKISLQNRGVLDGILSFKHEFSSQATFDDTEAKVKASLSGKDNARKIAMLGNEATYQQLGLGPVEMDFIESRKFTLSEICAVEGVPPILIIFDDPSLNNIREAKRALWEDTVIPALEDMRSALNLALSPEFSDRLVLDFDISGVEALREQFGTKIDTAGKLFAMGLPFNVINQKLELGFEEIENGDIGYLPMGLIPASEAGFTAKPEPVANESGNKARLGSEERKTAFWRSKERERVSFERAALPKIQKLFESEGERVVAAVSEGRSADGVINLKEWEKLLTVINMETIAGMGRFVSRELSGKSMGPSEEKAFTEIPAILEWVRRKTAENVTRITDTTKAQIKKVVEKGLVDGESNPTIAGKIRLLYESVFSRSRAAIIARTETSQAAGYGSQESAKQTGLKLDKQWISSRDDKVRDSHMDIDGETVGMDEMYSNGLMFPGDPDGAPEESINCRCVENYVEVAGGGE